MNAKKPTGYVLYKGPSLIDGAPIVAIAITGSTNRKTGDMIQTYILREDVHPCDALRTGQDASICGECKHRPALGGACYVVVPQGPTSVWKAYKRGAYPQAPEALGPLVAGRAVRLGTYGDPAAVPSYVWSALTMGAAKRTGYTHQWRALDSLRIGGAMAAHHRDVIRSLCMASCDSAEERAEAHLAGWRTFRVMVPGESLGRLEFACPASEEQGKRTTCAKCGACDGALRGTQHASPAIVVHGAKARRFIEIRKAA